MISARNRVRTTTYLKHGAYMCLLRAVPSRQFAGAGDRCEPRDWTRAHGIWRVIRYFGERVCLCAPSISDSPTRQSVYIQYSPNVPTMLQQPRRQPHYALERYTLCFVFGGSATHRPAPLSHRCGTNEVSRYRFLLNSEWERVDSGKIAKKRFSPESGWSCVFRFRGIFWGPFREPDP